MAIKFCGWRINLLSLNFSRCNFFQSTKNFHWERKNADLPATTRKRSAFFLSWKLRERKIKHSCILAKLRRWWWRLFWKEPPPPVKIQIKEKKNGIRSNRKKKKENGTYVNKKIVHVATFVIGVHTRPQNESTYTQSSLVIWHFFHKQHLNRKYLCNLFQS